jgi:hypothetical protein
MDVGPANSQTGPAIRGDQHTIESICNCWIVSATRGIVSEDTESIVRN